MLDFISKLLPEFIKPLKEWFSTKWRGMRFDEPVGGYVAHGDYVTLSGTYRNRGFQDHCVYTMHGDDCYPQKSIVFIEAEKRWTVTCHVNYANKAPSTVYLAECSPEIRCLFDYYAKVGRLNEDQHGDDQTKKNWIGITINKKMEGLKMIHSTTVRKE